MDIRKHIGFCFIFAALLNIAFSALAQDDQNGVAISCDVVLGGDDGYSERAIFAPSSQEFLKLHGNFMCRGIYALDNLRQPAPRAQMEISMAPDFWADPIIRSTVVAQFDHCVKLALIAYNDPARHVFHIEAGNVDVHPSSVGGETRLSIRYGPRANDFGCSLRKNLTGLQ